MSIPGDLPAAIGIDGRQASHAPRRLGQASLVVLGFTIVGKLIGILQQAVITARIGGGARLDVYFLAFSIPNFFLNVLLFGTVSIAFIPLFAEARQRGGTRSASAFASASLVLITLAMGAVMVAMWIWAEVAVRLLAPGFSASQVAQSVDLTRLFLPLLILSGLAAIFRGVLFSAGRFAAPLLAFNLTGITIVGFVFFLGPNWGLRSIAAGFVVGAAVSLLCFLPGLRRSSFRFSVRLGEIKGVANSGSAMLGGLALMALASELPRVVGRLAASQTGPGGVATFDLALSFERVVVGMFAVSIATAAYPALVEAVAHGNAIGFDTAYSQSINRVALTTLPLAIILFVQRDEVVALWLRHGAFGSEQSRAVSAALGALIPAMVAWAFAQVLVYAMVAQRMVKQLLVFVCGVGLGASVLYLPLVAVFGVPGITASLSIAAVVGYGLMGLHLWRRGAIGSAVLSRTGGLTRILLSATFALVVTSLASSAAEAWAEKPTELVGVLALVGGTDIVAFALAATALRVPEVIAIWRKVSTIVTRER
jgi:putative peptidoglycan lipid II flippase